MTTPDDNNGFDLKTREFIEENRKRFRNIGYVLIVVGILAILFPLIGSIAVKLLVGWFFLITGAVTLYHAFWAKTWSGALWSGVIGLIHLALGVYLTFFPLTGLIALTALVAIVFILQGGLELGIGLRHRPQTGWGWLALSGIASGLLGILLILGLPGTAVWALGVMLGLNAITTGFAFVFVARQS